MSTCCAPTVKTWSSPQIARANQPLPGSLAITVAIASPKCDERAFLLGRFAMPEERLVARFFLSLFIVLSANAESDYISEINIMQLRDEYISPKINWPLLRKRNLKSFLEIASWLEKIAPIQGFADVNEYFYNNLAFRKSPPFQNCGDLRNKAGYQKISLTTTE
jgi:hypothetical protein